MTDSDQYEKKDTRARIIEAAAETFAAEGYARATTRQIAAASGLTEMTLFRYFGSKKNLFAAVLEQYTLRPDYQAMLDENLSGDYAADMLVIGRYIMNIMVERREVMKMMICESAHFPELQETLGRAPRQLRDMVAGYLRSHIKAGQVIPRDPDMMAQAFLGFFFSYTIAFGFFDDAMSLDSPDESLLTEFVDLFVQGTLQSQG
jgi:TetR/AcrR family transcriptional repressor of mexJK operon